MGSLKGLDPFGAGKGGNFKAKSADLIKPFTQDMVTQQYQAGQDNIGQQQQFLQQLQGQNALGAQTNIMGQQQGLADQLQQQALGAGPNPALAQLNQATGQNVAAQTAMMAGQRGASSNAGLLARQAAMTGGNLQQQAVGQGATMQANQQLAAQQALMQQQQSMQQAATNQASALQGQYGQLGNQVMQQQANTYGGLANQNSAVAGNQANMNSVNGSIQAGNQAFQQKLIGGAFQGASSMMGAPAGMADGGMVGGNTPAPRASKANSMACEYFKQGGMVPGQPEVKGDDSKNDTVPAMLSPGEIVIPRTIVSKGPDAAAKFVQAVLAKQGMSKK